VTEAVDPDPYTPAETDEGSTLGGRPAPSSGADPTSGGREGEIGETPSIAADEPDGPDGYPVGGGRVAEESDQTPDAGS